MALNIKNPQVEHLATEVAGLAGETKTEAIRKALEERKHRLAIQGTGQRRGDSFVRFLEQEVWPNLAPTVRGRRLSREEEDKILGYGPDGV